MVWLNQVTDGHAVLVLIACAAALIWSILDRV